MIKLSVEIPEAVEIDSNPDGSRPSVTLTATGDRHAHVLSGLSNIGESDTLQSLAVGMTMLRFDLDEDDDSVTSELVLELAEKLETPFPEHSFDMDLVMEDGTETKVDFTVTAPSVKVAVMAMSSITRPRKLTQVAIGLCPTTDDDEDWGSDNEVLVRR